jgi:hypothetical protein
MVDLHPAGNYAESFATDVAGETQVGWIGAPEYGSSYPHAALWKGTPESVVDLHSFLPPGYLHSKALGIDRMTGDIVGYAHFGFKVHALLWRYTPSVEQLVPSSYSLLHGIPRGGNLSSLVSSDNDRLRMRMNFETSRLSPKVIMDATFQTALPGISRLDVSMEASTTGTPITQTISLWNGSAWVQVDSAPGTSVDSVRSISIPSGAGSYLIGGQIKVRVGYFTFDRENQSQAEGRLDQLKLMVYP